MSQLPLRRLPQLQQRINNSDAHGTDKVSCAI